MPGNAEGADGLLEDNALAVAFALAPGLEAVVARWLGLVAFDATLATGWTARVRDRTRQDRAGGDRKAELKVAGKSRAKQSRQASSASGKRSLATY